MGEKLNIFIFFLFEIISVALSIISYIFFGWLKDWLQILIFFIIGISLLKFILLFPSIFKKIFRYILFFISIVFIVLIFIAFITNIKELNVFYHECPFTNFESKVTQAVLTFLSKNKDRIKNMQLFAKKECLIERCIFYQSYFDINWKEYLCNFDDFTQRNLNCIKMSQEDFLSLYSF